MTTVIFALVGWLALFGGAGIYIKADTDDFEPSTRLECLSLLDTLFYATLIVTIIMTIGVYLL